MMVPVTSGRNSWLKKKKKSGHIYEKANGTGLDVGQVGERKQGSKRSVLSNWGGGTENGKTDYGRNRFGAGWGEH